MLVNNIKLIILIVIINIVITNIVITNNNIKINYNNIVMKNNKNPQKEIVKLSSLSSLSSLSPLTSTKTTSFLYNGKNETFKTAKAEPIIERQHNSIDTENTVIEVAKEWVLNKEKEITKETSLLTNIIEIAKKKLANISLRPNTIHLVIKYIIELVEETPIKGVEKKEFALKVMRELFKDLTEGEDEIVLLKLLDDGSISNIIDLVVDATNGKLNINATIDTAVHCATTCLPYCLSDKSKTKIK